ncbi:MAG: hypothetical protein RMX68_022170 [Aulosira sp. ZfuVER01]|nr:hypothetical protein [Aulosira sp. ZfuCHP01]
MALPSVKGGSLLVFTAGYLSVALTSLLVIGHLSFGIQMTNDNPQE